MIAIHINAGNNTNGNPRRGWIIADNDGQFVDFVDEGFQGTGALRVAGYNELPRTKTLKVTPATYQELRRESRRGG